MKLPITDNQVQLTSDADAITDVSLASLRIENSATPKVRATTVSGPYQANGLSYDATGRLFYVDATAGLPAGTTYVGGLPFNTSGALCVSSDAAATWANGVPFAANGAVSALFALPLTFSATLSSISGAMPTSLSTIVSILNGTPSSSITPSIATNRTTDSNTGVAPFGVQFDATGTTCVGVSNPFRNLHYSWNFGDDDAATWSYGTQPGVAKKNRASGGVAAHVFETPGTYTVKCKITNPLTNDSVTRSLTITVTDPDVVFAGANTICIANGTTPVPGVNGVPAGADCRNITTHAGIISVINANPQKRILMKRGDSWSVVSAGAISANGPGIIGAYGTGAKPVFPCTTAAACFTSSTANGCTDWRIMDLAYNATALATGTARNLTRFWSQGEGTGATAGKFGLLLRCESENAGTFAVLNADSIVADCNVPQVDGGGGNNAVYCGKVDRVAILGLNAPNATAAEHCMRLQGTRYSVVSNCTLENPATTKHALTLRGYSTGGVWEGIYTEYVVMSDNVMSSNTDQTSTVSSINGTTDERFRHIVFERNYVKSTLLYGINFIIKGGVDYAVRNNLFEMASRGTAVTLERGINTGIPLTGVDVYSNTMYASVAGNQLIAGVSCSQAEVTEVDIKNNVMYAPLHTSTKLMINFTAGSYTASNNTPNANIASVSPQFLATPPTTYAEWRTAAASYASGGGTAVPVYDDFFATRRGTTNSMGGVTSYGSSMVASTFDVSVGRADGSVDVEYRLTNAAQTAVTGTINTADITAIAGVDYTAQSGVAFSIPSGSASGTITIPILP